MKVIVKLSRQSGLYPDCLVLRGVETLGRDPVNGGHYGDVWKGQTSGHMIAIKVMRSAGTSSLDALLKVNCFPLLGSVLS